MKIKLSILICLLLVVSFVFAQEPIRVMTYNIKFDDTRDTVNGWSVRKDEVVGLIRYHKPLVFGTQEGLKHQLDYMEANLEGYTYFGVARDDGKEKGEYTAVFYNSRALKLIREATFWLSTTPDKPSKDWDAALPRVCTWAEMEAKATGKRFFVFNVHFDHVGKQARLESIKLIIEKINEFTENQPVVLMGDFNFEPDKAPYALVTEKLNDSRLLTEAPYGPEATFNGFAFRRPPARRIDYVFVNDMIQVVSYATLSDSQDMRYPSDHFPVLVELLFEGEE